MAQPKNVTRLKPPKEVIRTDKDAKNLQPREAKYVAKVEGVNGLRLVINPNSSKTWEAVFKINGKTATLSYGNFPSILIQEAIRRASDDYAQIKQGNDPRRQKQLAKQRIQSVERADFAIVNLAEERTAKILASEKMGENNAGLDRLYISYLQELIGQKSFCDLTVSDYSGLYEQTRGDRTRCEKLHKLIKKTFNYLDSKTKQQIPIDVLDALGKEWPIPKIPTRSEAFIRQADLGLFWTRLMHSREADIHKDAILMALLSGERKSAILSIQKDHICFDAKPYPYIYCEGKLSDGTVTKNVVPITPILGLFLKRLIEQSGDSKFLFPSRRRAKSPTMTDVSRQLLENDLGQLSGHKHSMHSLRRTTANLAGSCIGSLALADEHVLHFTNHTSKAKANYLDSKAEEFLIARAPTFERLHKYIDDAISSQGVPRGQQPADSIWRDQPMSFVAQAITFPKDRDSLELSNQEQTDRTLCATVNATETELSLTSPFYSYLAGEEITIPLTEHSRPHTWKAIHNVATLSLNDAESKASLTGVTPKPTLRDFKALID